MTARSVTGFVTAAIIFAVDQAAKYGITEVMDLDRLGTVRVITPFFQLRFVPNMGVSLGLLQAGSDVMRWGLVVLTGVVAAGVLFWMLRERNGGDLFGLGLVLGGAVGNIIDRVRFGYVVDWVDLHFGDWRPFLVFNLADAAITIGVLILLARALLVRDKPKSRHDDVENMNG